MPRSRATLSAIPAGRSRMSSVLYLRPVPGTRQMQPDGPVHDPVDGPQRSQLSEEPVVKGVTGEPEGQQKAGGHQAVLPPGQAQQQGRVGKRLEVVALEDLGDGRVL